MFVSDNKILLGKHNKISKPSRQGWLSNKPYRRCFRFCRVIGAKRNIPYR